MDQEIFNTTINSLTEKLGEETTAKIADDLGILKTAQNKALQDFSDLSSKLEQAEQDRLDMQKANARLLQQIPMGEPLNNFAPSLNQAQDKEPEPFDPRSAFKDGKLIK